MKELTMARMQARPASTRIRLLKAAARRPLLALGLAITGSLALAGGAATLAWRATHAPEAVEVAVTPRLVLNRVWFDKLPEKPTDSIDLWIFLGGGIAFHETGSQFDFKVEIAEFERRGSKLDITMLQNKKRITTAFDVGECHDNPPFNLCLTLKDMPGGAIKLYGFAYDDELERAAPWAKAELEGVKARAKAR
ncbi:MAG: hypothetical protein U0271_14350 [Polyangiaceae bacterium]